MSAGFNQAVNTMMGLDSQFAIQQNRSRLMQMAADPTKYSPEQMLKEEQQIMFSSLNNELLAKCTETNGESLKKQQNKNLKSTYTYFA